MKPHSNIRFASAPSIIGNNDTGWEEWTAASHDRLPNGSELMYTHKLSLGESTSVNSVHFLNGTFYCRVVRGAFKYKEHPDGGFAYSIASNHAFLHLHLQQYIS